MSTYKHIVHGDLEGQSDSIIKNFAIPTFTTTTESDAYLTRGGLICFVGDDLYVKPSSATAPFKAVPASLASTLSGDVNNISNLRISGSNLLFDFARNSGAISTVSCSISSLMLNTYLSTASFTGTVLNLTRNDSFVIQAELATPIALYLTNNTSDNINFDIDGAKYANRTAISTFVANKFLPAEFKLGEVPNAVAPNQNQVIEYVNKRPTATKTANYTITPSDYTIRVDATSGARIVTLPNANTMTGQVINIKKVDISTNTVTVNANGTQKIDDLTTKIITDPYTNLQLQSYGTGWDIL